MNENNRVLIKVWSLPPTVPVVPRSHLNCESKSNKQGVRVSSKRTWKAHWPVGRTGNKWIGSFLNPGEKWIAKGTTSSDRNPLTTVRPPAAWSESSKVGSQGTLIPWVERHRGCITFPTQRGAPWMTFRVGGVTERGTPKYATLA